MNFTPSWNDPPTTGDDSDYATGWGSECEASNLQQTVTPQVSIEQPQRQQQPSELDTSVLQQGIPQPPFATPPKLKPVEWVMRNNPGTGKAAIRALTIALARDAIFGREKMARCSLSGRYGTETLDAEKMSYIKSIVCTRVSPDMPNVVFEETWAQCRQSLSKSCQTLRCNAIKKQLILD